MENTEQKNYDFVILMNALGLISLSLVLIIAFYFQLEKSELPCPLCLLQRVGFILAGFGFFFNIYYKVKNTHYAMIIIGCMVTILVATRQILLHIMPGEAGYGSAFFGIHLYSWAFITSILCILGVVLIMILTELTNKFKVLPSLPLLKKTASALFIFLIAANLVSTVLECGSGQCVGNPVRYELLHHWFSS
ncbi:disulfide bond formation protein B [Bartonella sp. B30(2025)]